MQTVNDAPAVSSCHRQRPTAALIAVRAALLITAAPLLGLTLRPAALPIGGAAAQVAADSTAVPADSVKLRFDAELQKERPDFVLLSALAGELHRRAGGARFDSALSRRNAQVSDEIVGRIRDGFRRGDAQQLRAELTYCGASRGALKIPFDSILVWEDKANALLNAGRNNEEVQRCFDKVPAYLSQNRIGYARDALAQARVKLDQARPHVQAQDQARFAAAGDKFAARITAAEDSLVAVNISLITAQSRQAAVDYKRDILRKQRVSESKIAKVDEAIVAFDRRELARADSIATAQREKAKQEKIAVHKAAFDRKEQQARAHSDSLTHAAQQSLDRLRASSAARDKALQDSITAARNQQAVLAHLEKDLTQRLATERERSRREIADIEERERQRLLDEETEHQKRMTDLQLAQ